jgi:hypothetical protein
MEQLSSSLGNVRLVAPPAVQNGQTNGRQSRSSERTNGTNGNSNGRTSRNGSATPSVFGDSSDDTPKEERLIVGVDFGTTYSGYGIYTSVSPGCQLIGF